MSELNNITLQESETILFVDDEENILSSLRRLFRKDGYNIITAPGGAEGLAILKAQRVDIVISDMRMPEMNGVEFLTKAAKGWPSISRILLTGYSDMDSTVAAVNKAGIYQYVSKPWIDDDLKLAVRRALELRHLEQEKVRLVRLTQKQNKELKSFNVQLEAKVVERTAELQQTAEMLDEAYAEIKRGFEDAVEVFANLIELRDPRIAGHGRRVAALSVAVAKAMRLSESDIQDIRFAAMLHDLGKIALPQELVDMPYSALSEEQKSTYQSHAILGEAALLSLHPLHDVTQLIRSHHERYNGKGYPDGLEGEEIPLGARILSICNEYDGLQLGLVDKGYFDRDRALEYIRANSGGLFDPDIVPKFCEIAPDVEREVLAHREASLAVADLLADMVLSRDLVTPNGMLLLTKGHLLTDHLIEKIKFYEHVDNRSYRVFVNTA